MNQMCEIQVSRELIFYQRYLSSIASQIEKRNALRDSYNKIVAARDTNVFWNQESERNLSEMKKKIRKITKKQLRDFYIIR